VYVAVYVDNNLVRHNCDELVAEWKRDVDADGRIELNHEGHGEWFLAVRYNSDPVTGEVTADQEPYIDALADEYGLVGCNPCRLPLKPGVDLAAIPIPDKPDTYIVKAYAKLCGQLLYVAINTMVHIIYALHALTRYMNKATKTHMQYAKSLLRHVIGQKHRKLIYSSRNVRYPHSTSQIFGYSDASWADVIPHRKSTYCYLVMCNNAVFSWRSALSTILATSSGVSELLAMCAAAQEIAWARKFANECGFLQLAPTPLYVDSTAAASIAQRGSFKDKTKALGIRFSFICEYVQRCIIQINRIPRQRQLADIGTAARALPELERMMKEIYGEL